MGFFSCCCACACTWALANASFCLLACLPARLLACLPFDLYSDEHFTILIVQCALQFVSFETVSLYWMHLKLWNEKQMPNIGNYYLNNKRATQCHRGKSAIKNATHKSKSDSNMNTSTVKAHRTYVVCMWVCVCVCVWYVPMCILYYHVNSIGSIGSEHGKYCKWIWNSWNRYQSHSTAHLKKRIICLRLLSNTHDEMCLVSAAAVYFSSVHTNLNSPCSQSKHEPSWAKPNQTNPPPNHKKTHTQQDQIKGWSQQRFTCKC